MSTHLQRMWEFVTESPVRIFFFQAEDGIRDWSVTGVQTWALPISYTRPLLRAPEHLDLAADGRPGPEPDPVPGEIAEAEDRRNGRERRQRRQEAARV